VVVEPLVHGGLVDSDLGSDKLAFIRIGYLFGRLGGTVMRRERLLGSAKLAQQVADRTLEPSQPHPQLAAGENGAGPVSILQRWTELEGKDTRVRSA
jgi:hypothetical protein